MLALIFQVGRDRVALDVRRIREVVPRVHLSPVTGGPSWIAGVFVHRGKVVPVVDLHRLTGAGECPAHLSTRIILLPIPGDAPDAIVGLLATQVAEIREVPAEHARPIPGTTNQPLLGSAMPDGQGILRILDPDRLLGKLTGGSGGLFPAGVLG